jgi:hypothetical protein
MAMPIGIYAPQRAGTKRLCRGSALALSRLGTATTMSTNAMPSMARLTSSTAAASDHEPPKLAAAMHSNPKTVTLRAPKRSASEPATQPTSAPIALNIDSTHAAVTRPRCNSRCIADSAGGTFPTCMAAHTPARSKSDT